MPRRATAQALPALSPFHTAFATYGAAQRQGTRTRQADAYAIGRDPATGRVAVVVADGIGDHDAAAWAATMGADHAAAVALRTGSPARAVRETRARRNLLDLGCPDYDPQFDYWAGEGDTTLAVAVLQPGAAGVRVAWTGDCRVYRLGHLGTLQQITTDHTRGEHLRQCGIIDRDAPPCAADHIVTSRLAHGPIGTATIPAELTRRLLLCTDGISKQLDAATIGLNLAAADHARDAAEWLVDDADANIDHGDPRHHASDNITAVVLDLSQHHTGRHWSTRASISG